MQICCKLAGIADRAQAIKVQYYHPVRSLLIGYSIAVVSPCKIGERLGIELEDADLEEYGIEPCEVCGHYFDKAECNTPNPMGSGYLCAECVSEYL